LVSHVGSPLKDAWEIWLSAGNSSCRSASRGAISLRGRGWRTAPAMRFAP
jgi:hypothetical protein